MKPGDSLPHSQVPTTCPYPEPGRSSPYRHIQFTEDPSQYYPPTYAWDSQVAPGSPTKTLHTPSSPHTRYMPRPSHYSRFYHPKNTGWWVQIVKLLIMWFAPLPFYIVPLRPKYSQHPILSLYSSFNVSDQVLTPITNKRQIYSFVYPNLYL